MADETRERDRLAAVEARTTALRTLPVAAAAWLLVVVLVRSELALRVVTLVAILVSVSVAGRAAVTARAFLRRWGDTEQRQPPPRTVTLIAVAGAVATFVAATNVAADISADRSTTRATVLAIAFLWVTGAAVYPHVTGGRGVAAALRPLASSPGSAPHERAAAGAVPRVDAPAASPEAPGDEPPNGEPTSTSSSPAQLAELRLLFTVVDDSDGRIADPATIARRFRQSHPAPVVATARAQLAEIHARILEDRRLAQVVTLLGLDYHPPDDGITYAAWLARLDAALAIDPLADPLAVDQ